MASNDKKIKGANYFNNVVKSLQYSGTDLIKDTLPAVTDLGDANRDASKAVINFIKSPAFSFKLFRDKILNNPLSRDMKDILKNAKSDLKTGKFNNKERQKSMETNLFGDSNDESFDSFDFGDDSFDSSNDSMDSGYKEEKSSKKKNDKQSISKPKTLSSRTNVFINNVSNRSDLEPALTNANLQIKSSQVNTNFLLANQSRIHQEAMDQRETTNNNLSSIVSFNTDTFSPFISKSLSYYDDSLNELKNISGLMKDQFVLLNDVYGTKEKKTPKDPNEGWDEVEGNGAFSFANYAKKIGKNTMNYITDLTGFDLSAMGEMGMNPLKDIVASPLAFMSKAMVKVFIPKTFEAVSASFNSVVKNFGNAFLMKMNRWATQEEDGMNGLMKRVLGNIFGFKLKHKSSINIEEQDPTESAKFDRSVYLAITQVQPKLLSKIYSALTGIKDEIIIDYKKGGEFRWKSDVEKEYNTNKNNPSLYMMEYKMQFEDMVSSMNGIDDIKKTEINKDLQKLLTYITSHNNQLDLDSKEGKDLIKNDSGIENSDSLELFNEWYNSLNKQQKFEFEKNRSDSLLHRNKTMFDMEGLSDTNGLRQLFMDNINNEFSLNNKKDVVSKDMIEKGYTSSTSILQKILKTLSEGLDVFVVNKFIRTSPASGRSNGNNSPFRDSFGRSSLIKSINDYDNEEQNSKILSENSFERSQVNKFFERTDGIDVSAGNYSDFVKKYKEQEKVKELKSKDLEDMTEDEKKLMRDKDLLKDKLSDQLDEVTSPFQKFKDKMQNIVQMPFKKLENFMERISDNLYAVIFGKKNSVDKDGNIKEDEGLLAAIMTPLNRFTEWLKKKWEQVNNYLFGEKGLITKLKKKIFGEKSFKSLLFGDKDKNEKGIFTDAFNKIKKFLFGDEKAEKNFKRHYGKSLGIGGGLGLLLGAFTPFGPILGGILGATAGWGIKAGKLDKLIFGKNDKQNRIKKFFHKYGKSMGIGSGLGLLASIFLPGGPLLGMTIGALTGIGIKSGKLKELLFGNDKKEGLIKKSFVDKMKKSFPKSRVKWIAGAGVLGMLFGPGGLLLGGLFGGIAGLIGTMKSTKTFLRKMFFGNYNPRTKKGIMGLFPKLGLMFRKAMFPVKKYLRDTFEKTRYFMLKKVIYPLADAFAPFKKEFQLIMKSIGKKIVGIFDTLLFKPAKSIFSFFFKPFKWLGKKLLKGGEGFIKAFVGGSLTTLVGMVKGTSDRLKEKHLLNGDADYISAESIQKRKERDANLEQSHKDNLERNSIFDAKDQRHVDKINEHLNASIQNQIDSNLEITRLNNIKIELEKQYNEQIINNMNEMKSVLKAMKKRGESELAMVEMAEKYKEKEADILKEKEADVSLNHVRKAISTQERDYGRGRFDTSSVTLDNMKSGNFNPNDKFIDNNSAERLDKQKRNGYSNSKYNRHKTRTSFINSIDEKLTNLSNQHMIDKGAIVGEASPYDMNRNSIRSDIANKLNSKNTFADAFKPNHEKSVATQMMSHELAHLMSNKNSATLAFNDPKQGIMASTLVPNSNKINLGPNNLLGNKSKADNDAKKTSKRKKGVFASLKNILNPDDNITTLNAPQTEKKKSNIFSSMMESLKDKMMEKMLSEINFTGTNKKETKKKKKFNFFGSTETPLIDALSNRQEKDLKGNDSLEQARNKENELKEARNNKMHDYLKNISEKTTGMFGFFGKFLGKNSFISKAFGFIKTLGSFLLGIIPMIMVGYGFINKILPKIMNGDIIGLIKSMFLDWGDGSKFDANGKRKGFMNRAIDQQGGTVGLMFRGKGIYQRFLKNPAEKLAKVSKKALEEGIEKKAEKKVFNGLTRVERAGGTVAKILPEKVSQGAGKLLPNFIKYLTNILENKKVQKILGVKAITFLKTKLPEIGSLFIKKLAARGAGAALKASARLATAIPMVGQALLVALILKDITDGMLNANRLFQTNGDITATFGMRVAGALAYLLSNNLTMGLVPADWLARGIYDLGLFVLDDPRELKELRKSQESLKAEAKAKGISVDELSERKNLTWTEKLGKTFGMKTKWEKVDIMRKNNITQDKDGKYRNKKGELTNIQGERVNIKGRRINEDGSLKYKLFWDIVDNLKAVVFMPLDILTGTFKNLIITVKAFASWIPKLWRIYKGTGKLIFNGIKNIGATFYNLTHKVVKAIGNVGKKVFNVIKDFAWNILEKLGIAEPVREIYESVTKTLGEWKDKLTSCVSNLFSGFTSVLTSLVDSFKSFKYIITHPYESIQLIPQGLGAILDNAKNKVNQEEATEKQNNLSGNKSEKKRGMQNLFNDIGNGINNLKKNIGDKLDNLGNSIDNQNKKSEAYTKDQMAGNGPDDNKKKAPQASLVNTALSSAQGNLNNKQFPYFNQHDFASVSFPYSNGNAFYNGKQATIKTSGCGPTSDAMIASSLTGQIVSPIDVMKAAIPYHGFEGTAHSFHKDFFEKKLGMKYTNMNPKDKKSIDKVLDSGLPVLMSGKSKPKTPDNPFTTGGHYVVIKGRDAKGNYLVADPNKRENTLFNPEAMLSKAHYAGFAVPNSDKSVYKSLKLNTPYDASNEKNINNPSMTDKASSIDPNSNTTTATEDTSVLKMNDVGGIVSMLTSIFDPMDDTQNTPEAPSNEAPSAELAGNGDMIMDRIESSTSKISDNITNNFSSNNPLSILAKPISDILGILKEISTNTMVTANNTQLLANINASISNTNALISNLNNNKVDNKDDEKSDKSTQININSNNASVNPFDAKFDMNSNTENKKKDIFPKGIKQISKGR